MTSSVQTEADQTLRRARAELENAIRAGGIRRAEDMLIAYPALAADSDAALELIYTEFVLREEAGETPSFDEYHTRFPALRKELDELFQVHEVLRPDVRDGCDRTEPATPGEASRPAGARHIAGFEILEEIGRGGMGVVYRARQTQLGRIVALKVILSGAHAGAKERDRFRREVLSTARLDHPNIVRVYEVGEHDGHPYCVMEYVAGGSLADLAPAHPWPADAAAKLVALIARAAQHAHERGIVHRDLKPANILIAESVGEAESGVRGAPLPGWGDKGGAIGRGAICPKVADFGLAKSLSDLEPGPTLTGDLLGTPAYMAPEQAEGAVHKLGTPTDVWALGVILYELLTGRPPFGGDSAAETLLHVRRDDPVGPRTVRPRLPRDLETICLKCLEKDPLGRYATAAALADDLERWRRGQTIVARPIGLPGRVFRWMVRHKWTAGWLGALLFVTLLGIAGVTWYAFHAEYRREEAEEARMIAQRARDQTRAALYFQQVGRAFLEWEACNQTGAEALLASASQYERGWEWQYVYNLCHSDLLTLQGHTDRISCVAYTPDARTLVSATGTFFGSKPAEIRFWDAKSGALLREIRTGKAPIRGLAFSPDGARLATASIVFQSSCPGGVFFWDPKTGAELGALPGAESDVFSVAYSPDGRWLATGGAFGLVRLYEAGTLREAATLGRHRSSGVHAVAFSPNSRRLVSGGWDGTVRIWDVQTHSELHVLSGLGDIRSVAYSPDGRYVAAAAYGSVVRVWDAETGEVLATHDRHQNAALSVTFSPDGFFVASADNFGMIHVREALNQVGAGHAIRGSTAGIAALAFSADGTRLASGGLDGIVRVHDAWQYQGHRLLSAARVPPTTRLAYSPDGAHLASAGVTSDTGLKSVRAIRVWNAETGTLEATLSEHEEGVTGLAYNARGDLLASSSLDGTVRLWNAATGKAQAVLRNHVGPVFDIAFDPTDDRLASLGDDGILRLWRPREARELRAIDIKSGPQRHVRFSPDGTRLATAGTDGRVRLWDSDTLRQLPFSYVHGTPVTGLAFSPDGHLLASGSEDGEVRLSDLTGGASETFEAAHTRGVFALAFSPDGRRLATAGRDWTIKLWDVRTRSEAFAIRPGRGEVLSLAFRPDGRQMAAGMRDSGPIYLWEVGLDENKRLARENAAILAWHHTTARLAETARQWFSARFHLNRLIIHEPENAGLLVRRATASAELGELAEAESDLLRAAEGPGRPEFTFYARGVIRLLNPDKSAYQEVCRLALKRFGATKIPATANTVAWLCTLAPEVAETDRSAALALAELAARTEPKAWGYENTLGGILFRCGRFEDAILHLEESIRLQKTEGAVEDWLFLSMCHARLGRPAEASQWLARAAAYLDATAPDHPAHTARWDIRIVREQLRREAAALLPPAS